MTLTRDAKIYVAGHTGLLGSSVVRNLRARGHDNLLLSTRQEVNLTDDVAVSALFRREKPDLVVLTAAKVGGIQANIADPVGFLVENLKINNNVICSALEAAVQHLVYIGNSCMYPKDFDNRLKEEYMLTAPLEPTNEGYALAKISGAKLCEYCCRQYGVNYKTLIPCNLYGPGDHFDPRSSHLIAAIIEKIHRAMVNDEKTIPVWGDGSARREFLYVDDLADFICDCLDFVDRLPNYLNIGYGKDFTVLEYHQMAAEVMGYDGEFAFDTTRPVGMTRKLLDSSHAYEFGWNPKTSHRDGIHKTYEYYLSREKERVS
jgi:GDP-L-fucose synthase